MTAPRPREQRRDQYGTCSHCGKQRVLNADGTIRAHKVEVDEGRPDGKVMLRTCDGSHRPALARKVEA